VRSRLATSFIVLAFLEASFAPLFLDLPFLGLAFVAISFPFEQEMF